MANEVLQKQGTDRSWQSSGGDEVITLTSLANGAARKGDGHDYGATFPVRLRVELQVAINSAPTAGTVVEVYWASSRDNTTFDGNVAAGDAAFSDLDVLPQLQFVGAISLDNVTTVQVASWVFFLPARYGYPVVVNRSGQSLHSTASNHKLIITPLIDEIQ